MCGEVKSIVGVAVGMDQTEEAGTGEEGGPRDGAVVIANLANNNPGLVEGEGGAGLNDNDVVAAMNARNLSGSKPQNSVESSEESSEGGRGELLFLRGGLCGILCPSPRGRTGCCDS